MTLFQAARQSNRGNTACFETAISQTQTAAVFIFCAHCLLGYTRFSVLQSLAKSISHGVVLL